MSDKNVHYSTHTRHWRVIGLLGHTSLVEQEVTTGAQEIDALSHLIFDRGTLRAAVTA